MKCPKIKKAEAIDNHTLLIEFTNGEWKKYSTQRLLDKPMFAPLRNASFFKNFRVESGGYALVWNENIDISEYELWINGDASEGKERSVHND